MRQSGGYVAEQSMMAYLRRRYCSNEERMWLSCVEECFESRIWTRGNRLEVKLHQEVFLLQYDVFQDSVSNLFTLFSTRESQYYYNVKEMLYSFQNNEAPSLLTPLTCHDIVQELSVNCNSPLHIACKIGDLDKVKKLCQHEYIDVTNKDGDTPLHIACRLGHEEICKYITEWTIGYASKQCIRLEQYHRSISQNVEEYAIDRKLVNEGKVLISECLPSILARNKENKTPFQVALQFKRYSCMIIIITLPVFQYILSVKSMSLISLGYDEDILNVTDSTESIVVIAGKLYQKYMKECVEIVHDYKQSDYAQILAHMGFIPNVKNDAGQYPIETLLENSDNSIAVLKDVVKFYPFFWHQMIKDNYKIFCDACKRLKLFDLNKEIWKDLCTIPDENGNLLLHHICCRSRDVRMSELFSQCDINARNNLGNTPLGEAFLSYNYSVCYWLLLDKQCEIYNCHYKFQWDTDISILCKNIEVPVFEVTRVVPGDTLLHAAASSGNINAISFLVCWIQLNNLNTELQYPLHVACKSDVSIEVIHLLRDCDVTHKDIDGNTPLDLLYKHYPNRHDLMACAMGSSYYIPGVTPSPCSGEELVSTEWFCDLDFRELKKHHTQQNNALHMAVDIDSTILIEELKEFYPELFKKLNSEKNKYGNMPLHIAAAQRNLHCIQLVSEGCNINAANVLGQTCLHLACKNAKKFGNDLEVVKYLNESLNCNPHICDIHERSALHFACMSGNFHIVNYIITKMNVCPNIKDKNNCTPLMLTSLDHHDIIKLLIEHGADTSYLYDTYKEFFKRYQSETPPLTPLNIIVAGKPSSGKSTLIKALCSDGSQTIVEAEPHTAGIIPSSHHSDQLGCVSFYDLAGQSEYYASHEAVLHTVMASSTPLILLLIDSRKDQGLIQQDILYWLHFFKCQSSITLKREPQVILIFSFADQIPGKLAEKKIHCSKKLMTSLFIKMKFTLANVSFLDCRESDSENIQQLRSDINICASVLRESALINFLLHCFYAFLLHSFKNHSAVRICDVFEIKENWISSGINPNVISSSDSITSLISGEELDMESESILEEEDPANLLPDDITHFLKLSKKLHKKGHIILIENHNNVNESWLIISRDIILHEINGSLFAPSTFQHIHGVVSTSTGVVARKTVEKEFDGKFNINMLIGFLLHLEYCQKIKDEFVLKLLSSNSSYNSDEYYYFPGLVTIDKPQDVWNTPTESVLQCGWILRVEDAISFYTPRLIQILLLRVAFQNAFLVKDWLPGVECPSICRSCSVWKNGIFWRNRTGIECLLEVTENSQAIVFMLRSPINNLHNEFLMEFLLVRSNLIKTIANCVEDVCPVLNTLEYFCHPDHVQYPIKNGSEIGLYSMENIARAICQRYKSVQCNNPRYENLTLFKLIYFDPFMHCCFNQLFDDAHQNETIGDDGIQIITSHIRNGEQSDVYMNLLSHNDNDELQPALISLGKELYRWKERTYEEFRLHLSQFSIFAERNPQTVGKCLVKQYSREISDTVKNPLDLEAVFMKVYSKLVKHLQHSINSIADSCVSNGLISEETYEELLEIHLTKADKTRKLLMNIKKIITSRPGAFEEFCTVLTEHEFSEEAKSLKQALL